MSTTYTILTILFMISAVAMILIILVQRPQGGGLAGAFGGAGGGGTDSVFGGRVGDALTTATVIAFGVFLLLAVTLNLTDSRDIQPLETQDASIGSADPTAPTSEDDAISVDDDTDGGANDVPTFDPPSDDTENSDGTPE